MTSTALRRWSWIHKWSSLVCTVFMLILCITGLPLVFSHEIDHLTGSEVAAPEMPAGTPHASLDRIVDAAQARFPGLVPLYFFAEEDMPDLWIVKLDTAVDTDESDAILVYIDARSAEILAQPDLNEGFMAVIYRLHVDLYAGLPGKLFLGAMGLLLVIAIISGVVLYAPFMRRLDFGTVRHERAPRTRWLDLHNLLGIITLVWALVVGFTGVINTWAELMFRAEQAEQIEALQNGRVHTVLAPDAPDAAPADGRVETAVARALAAHPDSRISMIAFPGTLRATPEHFSVILSGNTPLTSRMTHSTLVDADTGEVLQPDARPWYITALQLSEPLHYGDYGGLPMKTLWVLLDLLTIIVLGSGLYLWLRKGAGNTANASLQAEVRT